MKSARSNKFDVMEKHSLLMIGSQMNRFLKSNQTFPTRIRPHSAVSTRRCKTEIPTKLRRPKSAEIRSVRVDSNFTNNQVESHLGFASNNTEEIFPLSTLRYTNSSARLLRILVGNPVESVTSIPDACETKSFLHSATVARGIRNHKENNTRNGCDIVAVDETSRFKADFDYTYTEPSVSDTTEGKIVIFLNGSVQAEEGESSERNFANVRNRNYYYKHHNISKPDSHIFTEHIESLHREHDINHVGKQIISPSKNYDAKRINETENDLRETAPEYPVDPSEKYDEVDEMREIQIIDKQFCADNHLEICCQGNENGTSKYQSNGSSGRFAKEKNRTETPSDSTKSTGQRIPQCYESDTEVTCKNLHIDFEKKKNLHANEGSTTTSTCNTYPSYEEIVCLLQTIDEDNIENHSGSDKDYVIEGQPELKYENVGLDLNEAAEVQYEVSVQETNEGASETADLMDDMFPAFRLEQLLNKNSIELAHEVLSLKIQIEDQKKGIKLLKDALLELKKKNRTNELDHQEALHKANAEAETTIQRHQKFISKLLNEKKRLNETVRKTIMDLKSEEERFKKNLKAMEERHNIELRRMKEAQAAADKIKREKWMERKTHKIKEMTVKGLEPELSRMVACQQQEIAELKNFHKAQLEAVELKAACRTSEIVDQLRTELTKEKETAAEREITNLRAKLERDFKEELAKRQNEHLKLEEQIRKKEDEIVKQEIEFRKRITDSKKEADDEKKNIERNFSKRLEEINRKHAIELDHLRKSLAEEKETWMKNYAEYESNKFLNREKELHIQYKKERDREIEMIIETLEKEYAQLQVEMKEASENKMERLKNKLENDIKDMEANEAILKNKLSQAKSELSSKEELISGLTVQTRKMQVELNFIRKCCEEMRSEKNNLRDVVRKEFDDILEKMTKEKQLLEEETSFLKKTHFQELAKKDKMIQDTKSEMQKELARVYTRIKTAVNKKDKIIESLRNENKGILQRCQQLELLLNQQRKNLLLQ